MSDLVKMVNTCRWAMLCTLVGLVCEVGIIAATFISLKNRLAWQKFQLDAGHLTERKEIVMLSMSLVTTTCVVLLTFLGSGSLISGLKQMWKGVRKLSTVVPYDSTGFAQSRMSRLGQRPEVNDEHEHALLAKERNEIKGHDHVSWHKEVQEGPLDQ
jgi:hypothetical protein